MIVNELQYRELLDFLRPILRLEPYNAISRRCESILKMPVGTTTGQAQYDRPLLKYKGYTLDVLHFRWFDQRGTAIHLHLKTKKKWWHPHLKDQNAEVVADLKRISMYEIHALALGEYAYTPAPECGSTQPPAELVYLHDARAFNRNWRHAFDMSPLLIAPDAHHGNCFIEFFFWGGGYVRENGMTTIRSDWLNFADFVSRDIEAEANRMLGLG